MTYKTRLTLIRLLLIGALALQGVITVSPVAAADKNKLTIVNQSGDDASIRVMGPREWLIDLPNGQERTVLLPTGN